MSTPIINPVPIPISDAIARPAREEFTRRKEQDPEQGKVTQPWIDYFTQQSGVLGSASARVKGTNLQTQAGSIAATDLANGSLNSGLYFLCYYLRVTQAATVSSSIDLTLNWKDRGQALTFTIPALTGNTVTKFDQSVAFLRIDGGTALVTYSTTYASVGGTPMQYSLDLALVLVQG